MGVLNPAEIVAGGGLVEANTVCRRPSDYGAVLVGPWFEASDPNALSGNPVERAGTRNVGATAQSSIASRRPIIVNGKLRWDGSDDIMFGSAESTLLSQVTPPDIPNAEPGKGWTTTGLALAPDGTWWIGNHGKKNEVTAAGETFYAGVVQMSADLTTVLRDVRCTTLGVTNSSVQGVAIEPLGGANYNVLFVVADGADLIVRMSSAGTLIGTLPYSLPNGIAFDIARQNIIVMGTNGAVNWIDKTTGTVNSSMTIRTITDSPDGLFYDQNGSIYVSGGPNIAGGLLIKYDVATKSARKCWVLDAARSIEHLHIDLVTGILTVCNDSYFHNSATAKYPALNTIQRYQLDSLASTDIGTKLIVAWTGNMVAQATGNTKALLVGGNPNPIANNAIGRGVGIYYTTNANEIRFTSRIGVADSVSVTWVLPDETVESNLELVYDATAGTAILYQNGVSLGTKTGLPTGTIPSFMYVIGALLDNTGSPANWANVELRSLLVAGT